MCIPGPVSWSGLGVCDSPECPRSRVIRSWGGRDPTAEGSGVRRQLVGFPRWVPWRVSPWWKSQGEPGAKQTLGGGTRDRQGAVLLAGLIKRKPGGFWGLLPQHFPPGSATGSHPPADGRVHLLPGAGKDSATAAEHPAQAVHPGSAPGMGQEEVGQSWLARVGMSLQFLGLRVGPSTLLSQGAEMFSFPWQGREPHST